MKHPATQTQQSRLPFKSRMLSLSLGGATLLLILIYLCYRMAIIGGETAMWAAVWVFVAAAVYESYMFSLVTRHMMRKLGKSATNKDKKPRTNGHRKLAGFHSHGHHTDSKSGTLHL